ncbi:MAG: metallophosphoesterase family protein [Acidobacteria bacterium]|nr:metallophosphoesterase family protein [Acidobacteriota bacterium]
MQIGALGDIHGAFDTVQIIMKRHPEVPLWVQVGDVATNDGEYFTPLAPLYWIKGNNEDFDVIAAAIAGRAPAPTLHYLPNGGPHQVGPWRVAALGGTFAPSWYNTSASALPPSKGRKATAAVKLGKSRDDKRRHFVRDEVLACKALTKIDLLLTHEAPRPFYPAGRRLDAGKTVLNDVLAAMRPRLHLFGHHHEFTDSIRQGVRSIGLDVVSKSYLLIDAETLRCDRLDT